MNIRLLIARFRNRPRYLAARAAKALSAQAAAMAAGERIAQQAHLETVALVKALRETAGPLDRWLYAVAADLEGSAAWLEKARMDAGLHGTRPDRYAASALEALAGTFDQLYRCIASGRRSAERLAAARGLAAGARKHLDLAIRRAALDPADFVGNLKFSSIYSALRRCADEAEKLALDLAAD